MKPFYAQQLLYRKIQKTLDDSHLTQEFFIDEYGEYHEMRDAIDLSKDLKRIVTRSICHYLMIEEIIEHYKRHYVVQPTLTDLGECFMHNYDNGILLDDTNTPNAKQTAECLFEQIRSTDRINKSLIDFANKSKDPELDGIRRELVHLALIHGKQPNGDILLTK